MTYRIMLLVELTRPGEAAAEAEEGGHDGK